MRFQAQLGKEAERMYKEGLNVVKLSFARVIKVNYKYNTVEVMSIQHKNSTAKNPNDNGKYSARLPIGFGGKTPDGNVYGTNTLVTIGSLVLLGFLEGNKDYPIVLNIYGDADNQSMLTRTTYTSADESDEAVQQELWQLFSLYPSMTYKNIDGRGNQEVTFSGKSFMYVTDSDQTNSYVQDAGFDYHDLPSSRYANGELIEPVSPDAPTVLYVHQSVYDKHRVTFFIKSDGTVRLGSRHLDGGGITFMEMGTNGSFQVTQAQDTTNPEDTSKVFSAFGIKEDGTVFLQSTDHVLQVKNDGVYVDNESIVTFVSGGGSGGGGVFSELQTQVTDLNGTVDSLQTSITVMNGEIATKVSETTYTSGIADAKAYADKLVAGAETDIQNVSTDVTNLQTYVDGSFKDGVITTAESQSIATYLNTLAIAKHDLDSQYTEIDTNPDLPASNKTSLESAKTDFDAKYTSLVNAINTAIADGQVDTNEKTTVDTDFTAYHTSITNLSTALQQAADGIAETKAQTALTNANGYTNNQISTVNSSITQLSGEIDSKVSSTTFTTTITPIQNTQTDLGNRLTSAENTINSTVQNIPYKAEIISTNGLVFKDGNINTTLFCKVFHGANDITSTIDASRFRWTRVSDDATGDQAWNTAHASGTQSITVTGSDVQVRATFDCDVLDTNLQ
jgi:hypothetical protein